MGVTVSSLRIVKGWVEQERFRSMHPELKVASRKSDLQPHRDLLPACVAEGLDIEATRLRRLDMRSVAPKTVPPAELGSGSARRDPAWNGAYHTPLRLVSDSNSNELPGRGAASYSLSSRCC